MLLIISYYHCEWSTGIYIVIKGSQTLHHWKRLATPHLANVLEHRPGIQNKGDVHIDSEQEEAYSLSDYEEDGTSPHITNPLLLPSTQHAYGFHSNGAGDDSAERYLPFGCDMPWQDARLPNFVSFRRVDSSKHSDWSCVVMWWCSCD